MLAHVWTWKSPYKCRPLAFTSGYDPDWFYMTMGKPFQTLRSFPKKSPTTCLTKIHQNPRSKIKNPRSKIQTPSVSAQHVSAQRVCLPTPLPNSCVPKGSNIWNPPLLPFMLMNKLGCLPHVFCILLSFFSCHQSCSVLHGILVHDQSPPKLTTIIVWNSSAQWAKCQAGNHQKSLQSLAHKGSASPKSGEKSMCWEKMDGTIFARVLFMCRTVG